MSEAQLTERLDQAIEAMLRNPEAPLSTADAQITELLGIAAQLRDLPRPDFKARLKNELERETSMSIQTAEAKQSSEKSTQSRDELAPSAVNPVRAGFRTITPYLTVPDVYEEIEFITRAFGAEGRIYGLGSAGGYHSEYKIGDSMVMIGGGGGASKWKGSPTPGSLHLYVKDVDAVYAEALKAGATSLMGPTDMEYGERGAAIQDVGGNHWYLATSTGQSYVPEGTNNLMPYLNPKGAPRMIEFLKQGFGAEEIAVHQSPEGIVHHAKIKIGDSIIEMGEAHGQWQPRPMTFMLYVEDCDAWYARAMKAEGAISLGEPANAPYGGRTGTVKDPFGNTWYISSDVKNV